MLKFAGVAILISALVIAFAAFLPGKEDEAAEPVASSRRLPECPSDTAREVDTFAENASRQIDARSGREISAAKVRREVLAGVLTHWPNGYPASCSELFALYVLTEAP